MCDADTVLPFTAASMVYLYGNKQDINIIYSFIWTSAAKGGSHLYAGKISTMNMHDKQ